MTDARPLLGLRGFGVAFGDRVVLRDVGFQVAGPGCTVVLGPSGTGKSTLLRTLAGYNQTNPSLRIWGQVDYQGTPCAGTHRPALVMQNSKLLVSNVLENLVCELPGRATLTQRMQVDRVSRILDDHGWGHLTQVLSDKVVDLPLVDQRAIAILRQLMAQPPLVMLDEPTTGLEDEDAQRLLGLIGQVAADRAVVVVLHHLQQARQIADQVVLLANGVVECCQVSPEFFEQPRGDCARVFLVTGSCPELAHEEPAQQAAWAVPAAQRPEPAPTARPVVSAACGPRGFLWLLPGELAGTPWPGIVHGVRYDLQALQAVGVTRLVSLTEVPFSPVLAGDFGIGCSSFPMPDMHPPTIAQGIALCEAIEADIQRGEVVAVHCRAGLGRTGTVLAAYWMWRARGAKSAVQALEDVRRIEPAWVQSVSQVQFLEEFALVVANRWAAPAAHHDPETATDPAASVQ